MSSPARTPRGRRGTVATLTALIVVLVCAAGATEAVSLAMHRKTIVLSVRSVAKFGRDTRLSDSVVLTVGIVAASLGLLLVLSAVIPARRRLVELTEPDPSVAAGLTRRSLARTLAAAAMSVDGVTDARIKGRRRYTVVARTALRDTGSLPDRVHASVTARLKQLNPSVPRAVRVRLVRKDA